MSSFVLAPMRTIETEVAGASALIPKHSAGGSVSHVGGVIKASTSISWCSEASTCATWDSEGARSKASDEADWTSAGNWCSEAPACTEWCSEAAASQNAGATWNSEGQGCDVELLALDCDQQQPPGRSRTHVFKSNAVADGMQEGTQAPTLLTARLNVKKPGSNVADRPDVVVDKSVCFGEQLANEVGGTAPMVTGVRSDTDEVGDVVDDITSILACLSLGLGLLS